MIISKTKYNELNNKIISLLKSNNEINTTNVKLQNQNDNYQKIIEVKDNNILELSNKYKIANATIGGLSKGNNKLKSDKENLKKENKEMSLIISKMKKQIELLTKEKEKLSLSNNEFMIENKKMIGIIDNLNKMILKKMKKAPTKEQIINYDRKEPRRSI